MKRETVKKIIKATDKKLGSNFSRWAKRMEEFWNNLGFLNVFRRKMAMFKLQRKIGFAKTKEMKLHLGCGSLKKEDYINIDVRQTPATDLVWDITENLPFKDNSVERIECYHLLEHLPVCLMANINPAYGQKYDSIVKLLKEWRRVLKLGGKLVIEAPDFDKLAQEYVAADEKRKEEILIDIYGGFRNKDIYDVHRWGVNQYRLRHILQAVGFQGIEFKEAEDYHVKLCPCLRAEAIK